MKTINIMRLGLKQYQRRHFILVIIALAAFFVTLLFIITAQQIDQTNARTVLRLDKQSELLANDLRDVPAKPQKIKPEQRDYWRIVKLKKQLLYELVQTSKAKKAKNEINYRHHHEKMLTFSTDINGLIPNFSDQYLQKTPQTVSKELTRDRFLKKTGQTIMIDNYSLSIPGFLLFVTTVLANPIILSILIFLFNCIWREDFDSETNRLLLLSTPNRRSLLFSNFMLNMLTFITFLILVIAFSVVLCTVHYTPERISWQYPLGSKQTIVQKIVQLLIYLLPLDLIITMINDLSTIFIKQLNFRIAANIIIVAAITFGPIFRANFNLFWQTGRQLFSPIRIPWLCLLFSVLIILVGFIILTICLRKYTIKNKF
ncbi:hypothetical protein [Lapidilactobacillus wuchangensis]|uniref:hypothetical protein n=1 Tax=Lapidilactobacillus wuchangensis TaxID=2486001 RepID=UPI000F7A3234|nr:hypothetical protein [Lapidilactobacillus wuchangensis]